jgi:hypothetical protein
LPKLKHKLIMTQDINYYTFNINGDLGLWEYTRMIPYLLKTQSY